MLIVVDAHLVSCCPYFGLTAAPAWVQAAHILGDKESVNGISTQLALWLFEGAEEGDKVLTMQRGKV